MISLKLQINPKFYNAALFTGAALVLSAATSAGYAQGSFTIKKNQLDPATPFKARQQLQIVDESPIVTDVRRKQEPEKNYQINIPALSSIGGGAGGVVTLNPTSRNLPSAGFNSNIPAGGTGVNRNLPGVEQGHLGKQMAAEAKAIKSTSVRPIGRPGIKPASTPSPQVSNPASPAAYSSYKNSVGGAGSSRKTTAEATGKIQRRDLLLK
jgi:hypothetical protein